MVITRQAVHGGGLQGLRAVAIQVADGHENLQRFVLHGLPGQGEKRLDDVVGLLPGGGETGQFAVVLALGMISEEVLPYIEIAGHMGLAVGIQVQTRGEQHHVGVGAKDGPRRSGTGDAPAHRGVKALHPLGLEQVLL